jgi:hypothetical protein
MFLKKLFIHIPKNAGMTIRRSDVLMDKIHHVHVPEELVSKQYYENLKNKMIQTKFAPPGNPTSAQVGIGHCRWRDVNVSLKNSMDCFAVIRNPWSRTVSRYFFAKKLIEVEKKDPVGRYAIDSFESFLEERFKWGDQDFFWHRAVAGWYQQKDYVVDENDNLKCDILRFEKLNPDTCLYFKVPQMTGPRNVTGLNKENYQSLYTPKTIQIIADWYKEDIEYFGFDFDTSATKNYWNKV